MDDFDPIVDTPATLPEFFLNDFSGPNEHQAKIGAEFIECRKRGVDWHRRRMVASHHIQSYNNHVALRNCK
jgi:hypothetical protein